MPIADPERRRAHDRDRHRRARAEMRAIIERAKDVPCADCGGRWPYFVMSFDHVRGTKEFTIATAIQRTGRADRVERLLAEIAKCDVVCANCHALRHGGHCGPNERGY